MNEIDRIWATPREELHLLPPKDFDTIVAYYKAQMAALESGQKVKKNPGLEVTLEDILEPEEKPKPATFQRRSLVR